MEDEVWDAINYVNYVLLILLFLYFAYVIIHSCYLNYKDYDGPSTKLTIGYMHMILMLGNVGYLIYQWEWEYHWLPAYYAQTFLVNCAVLISFKIISEESEVIRMDHCEYWVYYALQYSLWAIMVACIAVPKGYKLSIQCDPGVFQYGINLLAGFQLVYSCLILFKFRNCQFDQQQSTYERIKEYLERFYKKDVQLKYDRKNMILSQLSSYLFYTKFVFILQVINIIQDNVLRDSKDYGIFTGKCSDKYNGWRDQESVWSQCLLYFILGIPIEMCMEVFYHIPIKYGYFDQNKDVQELEQNENAISESEESEELEGSEGSGIKLN